MAIVMPKPNLPEECIVDNRVYTDPRALALEQERIFLRVWNFVCHESEIASPGDYLTTMVAGQPVLICRNSQGRLNAFYNTCRHRAAQVVQTASGNARRFTCLYHHWSYDLDGRLITVPEIEAYRTSFCPLGLQKDDTGLVSVRIDSVHGLVFICFDDQSSTLSDYLGELSSELQHPFSSADLRVRVAWTKRLRANWKMQPENSRDGYHATLLHKRLRGVSPPRPYRLYPGGHAVQHLGLDYEAGRKSGSLDGILIQQPELADRFMAYPLPGVTREQPSRIITIFPDVLIAIRFSTLVIERQIPIDVGATLFETRYAYLESDTDEMRDIRSKHWHLYWAQDAGNLPEDWEAWEAQQIGAQGIGARYSLIARGEPASEGLRGDDNRIRSFWQEWRRCMGLSANALPE